MFLQLIHCCPILHVHRSFAKLLGEVSLCRISEVEHNLCSSVSSRMRHRFRSSPGYASPPSTRGKWQKGRCRGNETKGDRNSRRTRDEYYHFLNRCYITLFRLTEYPRRREDLENCSKTIHKLTILTTFIQSDRRLNLSFSLEIDYIVTLSTETSINAYSVKIHVRSE